MFVFAEDSILQQFESVHWKLRVVIMPTLPSMLASEVVITTTCSATSDDKIVIMKTLFSMLNDMDLGSLDIYTALIILAIAQSTMVL